MPDHTLLSSTLRRAIILLCCIGVVGGLGCATYFAANAENPKADAYYNKPSVTDTIFALARPDDAMAKKIGYENAIAFLGKKHTYLLVEGGTQLTNVAHQLDGRRLAFECKPRQVFLKDKTIWGNVSLCYTTEANAIPTPGEVAKLAALGFQGEAPGVFRLIVPVKGVVLEPAKLSKDVPDRFDITRDIAFFHAPDTNPPPDLGKLVTVPLAVAVDVVLSPVYVLGLVVLALSAI